MTLHWEVVGGRLGRGSVIEASSEIDNMLALRQVLFEAWTKVVEVLHELNCDPSPTILVEVWPDSGRIIFILQSRRDLARLVLRLPVLEHAYYAIPDNADFDFAYGTLVEVAINLLKDTVHSVTHLIEGVTVLGRDTDDVTTEQSLI